MLILVDYQVVPTTTVTLYIFGIYNTETGGISYYKKKELYKFICKETQANPKFRIKGIPCDEELRNISVYRIDGIEFITEESNYNMNTLHYMDLQSNKLLWNSFHSIETIYTKPIKIERFTSSMTFWYQGVKFEYKDKDKDKRASGFNVVTTIGWKQTKNYFYVNKKKYPILPQGQQFIAQNWPSFMAQDYFAKVLNMFQQYYPITSFYRTNLPYCKELDLSAVNMEHITSLRNCFWKNKTLEKVSFNNLNLDNITDFYWPFQDDANLKYIDFRGCKGDLQISDKLLTDISRMGTETCLLLNDKQVNFIRLLSDLPSVAQLANVKTLKDVQNRKEFVIASNKLMKNSTPSVFFVVL